MTSNVKQNQGGILGNFTVEYAIYTLFQYAGIGIPDIATRWVSTARYFNRSASVTIQ